MDPRRGDAVAVEEGQDEPACHSDEVGPVVAEVIQVLMCFYVEEEGVDGDSGRDCVRLIGPQ